MRRRILTSCALALVALHPRSAYADAEKGQEVYKSHQCAMCHKINGAGGKKGPALDAVGTTRDAAWLEKYLTNPKSVIADGTMPPAKVSRGELKNLIDYLQALKAAR
jgi:cytochrome c2